MIKAVKVLNVFSVILFAGVLLLVYAYLPIKVDLKNDLINPMNKQHFFYYAVTIFILGNLFLRVIFHFGLKGLNAEIVGWFTLLIFAVNFYLSVLIGFIGVLNNPNSVEASSFAYLTYLGPILILGWIIGLIILFFKSN